MSEHLLRTLLLLSAELAAALLLMLGLRPLLRRGLGAGTAYGAWLLVPLLLAVAQLPATKPGLVLHHLVLEDRAAAPALILHANDDFEGLAMALLALWVLGAAAVLFTLAVRQRRFMHGLRFDAPNDHWRGPVGSGPALLGLLRQRLCLPADFEQRFDPDQQALILAHEAVHQRRRDNAWNLLAAMVCALQWFNPLVWIAARALRADQELACDEAVLRQQPTRAHSYARALLEAQGVSSLGLPWASWRSTHPLIERIAMLKAHVHARRRTGVAVLLMLGLLGGGAVHALQSVQPGTDADVKLDVVFEYSETVDGKLERSELTSSLNLRSDQPSRLHMPTHGSKLELVVAAAPHHQDLWKISAEISRDGKPLGKPRLITKEGVEALIETGERGPKGEDLGVIRIAITPTALKPRP